MTAVTLTTLRHNADGTVTTEFITVDPENPANPRSRRLQPVLSAVFLARLTVEEYGAIMNAAAAQLASGQPQLSLWIDTARVRGNLLMTDPAAIAAKTALVSNGLLTQDRSDIIFASTPT